MMSFINNLCFLEKPHHNSYNTGMFPFRHARVQFLSRLRYQTKALVREIPPATQAIAGRIQ